MTSTTSPTPAAVAKARVSTTKAQAAKAQATTDALDKATTDALQVEAFTSTSEAPSTFHGVTVTVPLSTLTGALTSADRSEDRVSAGFTWLRLQWLALAHYKATAKQVTGPDGEAVTLAHVVKSLNLASDAPITKAKLTEAARVYGYVGALGFDQTASTGDNFAQAAPVARTLRTLVSHTRKDVLDALVTAALQVPMAERGQYIADKGRAARIKAEENRGIAAGAKAEGAAAGKATAALAGSKSGEASGQNNGGAAPADASGKVVAGPTGEPTTSPAEWLVQALALAASHARNNSLSADSDGVRAAFDALADALGLGA